VIDKALARTPTERYETAPEFAHALADAVGARDRSVDYANARARRGSNAGATSCRGAEARAEDGGRSAAVLGLSAVAVVAFFALRGRADGTATAPTVIAPPAPPPTAVRDSVPGGARPAPPLAAVPNANSPKPALPDTTAVVRASRGGCAGTPRIRRRRRQHQRRPERARPSYYVESLIVGAREDPSRSKVLARTVLDSARAIVPRLDARTDNRRGWVSTRSPRICCSSRRATRV
jgi:hypothetical protein